MKKEFRTKIVSILLTLAMVSLVIVPFGMTAVFADGGYAYEPDSWDQKQISLSSGAAAPGKEVTLTLSASDFTAATSVTMTFSYDTDKLSGPTTITRTVTNGVVDNALVFTVSSSAEPGTKIEISIESGDASISFVKGYITVLEPEGIPGDVDGDEVINIVDLTTLAEYLANYDTTTGSSSVEVNGVGADVNEDGLINITDLTALAEYLANH